MSTRLLPCCAGPMAPTGSRKVPACLLLRTCAQLRLLPARAAFIFFILPRDTRPSPFSTTSPARGITVPLFHPSIPPGTVGSDNPPASSSPDPRLARRLCVRRAPAPVPLNVSTAPQHPRAPEHAPHSLLTTPAVHLRLPLSASRIHRPLPLRVASRPNRATVRATHRFLVAHAYSVHTDEYAYSLRSTTVGAQRPSPVSYSPAVVPGAATRPSADPRFGHFALSWASALTTPRNQGLPRRQDVRRSAGPQLAI